MAEDGTIRFAYSLEQPVGPITGISTLESLAGWRAVLKRLAVLGQDADRYGGAGFGNLSSRDLERPEELVITASQTAGAPALFEESLVRITHCNPARFWVDAIGHQPPSSETLTHATIYQAAPEIEWVFHVHSPEIWQRHADLELPATPEEVTYGSPAMAEAVSLLLSRHRARPLVFVTLGHEDGVFACGGSADETGSVLVRMVARALA